MAQTILTPGQKRLLAVLLVIGAFLLGNAAYLFVTQPQGSVLPTFYQWMLVLHVAIGLAVLAPMAWFIAWHWKRAMAMRNPRAVATGVGVTVAIVALAVTGIFITEQANSADNRVFFVSHQLLALAVPLAYAGHRLLARHRPPARLRWAGLGATIAVFLGLLGTHHLTHPGAEPEEPAPPPGPREGVDPWRSSFAPEGPAGGDPDGPFFPAATRTRSGGPLAGRLLVDGDRLDPEQHAAELAEFGFVKGAALGSASCAGCHQDVTAQWARSVHRFSSFNNPFYRVAVDDLRAEDDGRRRSQWCAACHDPAVMLTGAWLGEVDPTVPESQAGLTCLSCHAIDGTHGVGGNGNYIVADDAPDPYLFASARTGPLDYVHDLLVKAKPDVHKREMLAPILREPEFCATCHKVSLDVPVNRYRWLRGQNEYDNWHDSGVARNAARTFYLPPVVQTCHDCHMPRVAAPLGDLAAKNGTVRSHLFHGPNTAISHLLGDEDAIREKEEFLQGGLRVDVMTVKRDGGEPMVALDGRTVQFAPGDDVEVHVVVRNQGVGHTFPGGTTDSNQAWLHVRVTALDDPERVLFESGAFDPLTRRVDPEAHDYRTVFVNENGHEMKRRNAADFRTPVLSRSIGPGTADLARYAFRVPPMETRRFLRIEATLRWRKFNRAYTEYAWERVMPGRPVPELPVTDVARSVIEIPVGPGSAAPSGPPPGTDWIRWNDWGIAALLQGDTLIAQFAFEAVAALEPERPDGPRNLARTALADGRIVTVLTQLDQAEERAPSDPQTAYHYGVALERVGDLAGAIDAYTYALDTFPEDRTIHRALARLHYKLDDFDAAMKSALRVLAIDPEDRVAHWMRFQIYRAMGDEDAAAVAESAYRKFAPDESAQAWTESYRRENPAVNREDQSVHVHRLEPIE